MVQVCLRLPVEAFSTIVEVSASPANHSASTPSCSASVLASAADGPVTMLMTPEGTSEVSMT